MLSIRLASTADCNLYFKWVNEQIVRRNSINQKPVSADEHNLWFSSRLGCESTYLYVLEKSGDPIGQVRFDVQNNTAEISYSVDVRYRNQGYGSQILQIAINEFESNDDDVDTVVAKAKSANVPSCRLLKSMQFEIDNEGSEGDILLFRKKLGTMSQ